MITSPTTARYTQEPTDDSKLSPLEFVQRHRIDLNKEQNSSPTHTLDNRANHVIVAAAHHAETIMPAAHTPGFDESYYLNQKLAQLQKFLPDWQEKGIADVRAAFNDAGLTPEQHYNEYGWREGLSPSRWFSPKEYYINKAMQLIKDGICHSINEGHTLFIETWQKSPWQHYIQYGAMEGINPSGEFSDAAYLQSKLEKLIQNDPGQYGNWSTADLLENFAQAGLTPLGHYYEYGQYEELSYHPLGAASNHTLQAEGVQNYHLDDFVGA